MTGSLSPQQVERYWRDGYLFPLRVMDEGAAGASRRELEATEARHAADLEGGTYFFSNPHFVLPFADRLNRHPAILDAVESLLGPDILVWNSTFFIKEAGSDAYISWHQDLTYWGLGPTDEEVTAWLAFSPATPESGCMRFVAGSHEQAIVPHQDTFQEANLLTRGQEIAVEVNEADAVEVCLAPGEMSLHHGRMFHASGPNFSKDRRIGYAIRYITPQVRQHVGSKDYAMLVRGEDRFGNFIPVPRPQRDFDPEDVARFRRIQKDEEEYYYKDAEDVGKRVHTKTADAPPS